jgi:hypothetical protein
MKDINQIAEDNLKKDSIMQSETFSRMDREIWKNGFIKGFKQATKWNSPEVKPEEGEEILFCYKGVIYKGMYDIVWKRWVADSGQDFIEIDGWQYLPSID